MSLCGVCAVWRSASLPLVFHPRRSCSRGIVYFFLLLHVDCVFLLVVFPSSMKILSLADIARASARTRICTRSTAHAAACGSERKLLPPPPPRNALGTSRKASSVQFMPVGGCAPHHSCGEVVLVMSRVRVRSRGMGGRPIGCPHARPQRVPIGRRRPTRTGLCLARSWRGACLRSPPPPSA